MTATTVFLFGGGAWLILAAIVGVIAGRAIHFGLHGDDRSREAARRDAMTRASQIQKW